MHSLHETLYRPAVTSTYLLAFRNMEKDYLISLIYGILNNGMEFLKMFNFGERKGKPRFFTYVVSYQTYNRFFIC